MLSKIIKAKNLLETDSCRVDAPEPRLFFIDEPEPVPTVEEETIPEPEISPELILEQAQDEAERILSEAQAEAKRIQEASQREGFEQGLKEALVAAEQQLAGEREEIAVLRQAAEVEYTKRVWESEGEILKLACEIAEVIIRTSITEQPESWLKMVREAVAKVAGANELILKVSPEDAAVLNENLSLIREVLTESSPIRIETDISMKPGDLWIESNIGQVDARITQQLQVVIAQLRAGMVQP